MHGYPLLDAFLTILYLFLWIMWIFLLIRIIGDVFRSHDLTGWGKAGWTFGLIIFPLFGVLLYLIFRGGSMHEREVHRAEASQEALHQYLRQATGAPTSAADELTKLAALRDSGVITPAEFDQQKAKLLAA
jgi:signal transduction histidine kinase